MRANFPKQIPLAEGARIRGRQLLRPSAMALLAGTALAPALAGETITYTYDSLGRVIAAQSSGTVNNGRAASYCYDAAGNRIAAKADANGALVNCSPTPSPTPTPTPAATITANNPTLNYSASTTNTVGITTLVTLNGATGTITSFSVPVGGGSATIAGGGQSVSYTTPAVASVSPCDPPNSVTVTIPYTVQNSVNAQTTSGTMHANVEGKVRPGICQ